MVSRVKGNFGLNFVPILINFEWVIKRNERVLKYFFFTLISLFSLYSNFCFSLSLISDFQFCILFKKSLWKFSIFHSLSRSLSLLSFEGFTSYKNICKRKRERESLYLSWQRERKRERELHRTRKALEKFQKSPLKKIDTISEKALFTKIFHNGSRIFSIKKCFTNTHSQSPFLS